MFLKNRQVWWPAQVQQVAEDGTATQVKVPLRLVIMTKAELNIENARAVAGIQEQIKAAVAKGEEITEALILDRLNKADAETIARIAPRIVGWGLKDDAGEPVPFTPENLSAVLEWADLRQAFASALREASNGAPIKN